MRKNVLAVLTCALLSASCGRLQGNKTIDGHRIHLVKDTIETGFVSCYADNQELVFNDDLLDGGTPVMRLYQNGKYAYVVGDLLPNSDGWTVRYHLYRVDTQSLEIKYIGIFAAIHFDENGFKAATTRLTNPDANTSADRLYAIRNNFYDNEGVLIRRGESEYYYDDMIIEYSDSLVNADGYRPNS